MSRRVFAGVVMVGGLAATLGLTAYGAKRLLVKQAAIARGLIGDPLGHSAPGADKVYGKKRSGRVELCVLGDSIAAGLGAERGQDTLGARLAKQMAKKLDTSVKLRTAAVVGSETHQVIAQVQALPPLYHPDVAVIIVGGNDVTHRIPIQTSAKQLGEAIDLLHDRGASVVVGLCPDVGALRLVPQPLRTLGSRVSKQLAAAQRDVALAKGARAVSLSHVVGPFFLTNPDEMFSLDNFHPSAAGYRRTAKAMLPSVLAAAGMPDVPMPFGHHHPA